METKTVKQKDQNDGKKNQIKTQNITTKIHKNLIRKENEK